MQKVQWGKNAARVQSGLVAHVNARQVNERKLALYLFKIVTVNHIQAVRRMLEVLASRYPMTFTKSQLGVSISKAERCTLRG